MTYRPRGTQDRRILAARRIVNCTSPQGDLLGTAEPLLRNLLGRGTIRPDPLRIGVDVNERSEVVNRDGVVIARLPALGPITRGAFWEVVAVPDIRHQTLSVARQICETFV